MSRFPNETEFEYIERLEAENARLREERDEWERKFWAEKEAYRSLLESEER